MMKKFESLPHTADIKIRVFGKTKEHLFQNALYGMFQVIGPITDVCSKEGDFLVCEALTVKHDVEVHADQQDLLLVDFLSEALYLSDVHDEAYFDADIHHFDKTIIKATVKGVPVQGFETEIKAVTYHELEIKQADGVWQAIIVFDI